MYLKKWKKTCKIQTKNMENPDKSLKIYFLQDKLY